jgi:hypothetical protein
MMFFFVFVGWEFVFYDPLVFVVVRSAGGVWKKIQSRCTVAFLITDRPVFRSLAWLAHEVDRYHRRTFSVQLVWPG